jgi:copper chaperone CopZ
MGVVKDSMESHMSQERERVTIHLQNVLYAGCVHNVEMALKMVQGVRAVQVHKAEQTVDVLFEAPATPLAIREQLLLGGYLAEPDRE